MPKFQKIKLALAFISLFALISLVQTTYSKYNTSAFGDATMSVARWQIAINDQDIIQDSFITNVIVPTIIESDHVKAGVLAPRSTAYFDLVIDYTNVETSFEYTLATSIPQSGSISDLRVTAYSENGGDFVAFDLFFRSDSAVQLYMTPNSQIVTPDTIDTGIKNTARVGFVHLGSTAIGSSTTAIQSLNAGVSSAVNVWEPNIDVHTAAAVAHAFDTYGLTTTETGATALTYSGVHTEFDAAANLKVGDAQGDTEYVTQYTPDYRTIYDFSDKTQIFNLSAGISKIRIYMWIEGQDVDCENSASGGNTTFNLQITNEL